MKAKERVQVAMSRGIPDRVPFIPQICVSHAVKMLGLDFENTLLETVRNPALMGQLTFECVKQYGVDGFRAWLPADPLDVVKVDDIWYGVDPASGKRLGRVDFEGGGGVLPLDKPELPAEEDIERIPVLTADEIIKSGKLDSLKKIIAEAGDDYFVITAPPSCTFEHLTFVLGKMQALMDIMDRPEFCHKILEKAVQVAIEYGKAYAEIGFAGILLGDTYGGVISPAQFSEFIQPYVTRFVNAIKGRGPKIYLHVCGRSSGIFELMADTGVDCIEPLDNLAGVSVADAKARVGHRVALMGGVNTLKLANGTLDELVADGHRCLNEGAVGGGYILACSDMLPTETAPEKVHALVQMCRDYNYAEKSVM